MVSRADTSVVLRGVFKMFGMQVCVLLCMCVLTSQPVKWYVVGSWYAFAVGAVCLTVNLLGLSRGVACAFSSACVHEVA